MLSLLLSSLLVPISYGFTPGVKATYDVEVIFNGYIPIFGGQEGKVEVSMSVDVEGLAPDAEKRARAASEIKAFGVVFNGSKLPLGLDAVQSFFPRTTVSLSAEGKVLKTDAPDLSLPVRLPGLDVKRFPDITYLPIEFPSEGIEEGKAFTFKKQFGDSNALYTVTPISIKEDSVELDVKMAQTYTVLEDAGLNVVKDEKEAVSRVSTELSGAGKVVFDRKRGMAGSILIDTTAVSKVTTIKTKETTERKLATTLKVKLKA